MAEVQVLSTPGCAGCDTVKRLVAEVLSAYPDLEWEEVDLVERPEVATRFGIMSVPVVVIGGRLEFTGVPPKAKLRKKIETFVEGR